MLAWMIFMSIVVSALVVVGIIMFIDLYKWIDKLDKLLEYNPYDVPNYRRRRFADESTPYDTTPEFIKGIKNMVYELNLPSRRSYMDYSSSVSRGEFEDLSDRFDSVAEDSCRHDNRLDDHESEINAIRELVQDLNSALTRRVDNLEKWCYGTKEGAPNTNE